MLCLIMKTSRVYSQLENEFPTGWAASERMNSRQGGQPVRASGCAASQRMKSQQGVQPVRQWSLFNESMEIVELTVLYVVFLLLY